MQLLEGYGKRKKYAEFSHLMRRVHDWFKQLGRPTGLKFMLS